MNILKYLLQLPTDCVRVVNSLVILVGNLWEALLDELSCPGGINNKYQIPIMGIIGRCICICNVYVWKNMCRYDKALYIGKTVTSF